MSDHEKMEAAMVLMHYAQHNKIGFKLSGGLNGDNYAGFVALIKKIMQAESLSPQTIRLGASGLMDDLRVTLESKGQIKHVTKPVPAAY